MEGEGGGGAAVAAGRKFAAVGRLGSWFARAPRFRGLGKRGVGGARGMVC
jgi:hypothetical protein